MQFDLGAKQLARLDHVKEQTEARSRVDVIEKALSLYGFLVEQRGAVTVRRTLNGVETEMHWPGL